MELIADITGTYQKCLSYKGCKNEEILLPSMKGYRWNGCEWEKLCLPRTFIFINLDKRQPYKICKSDGHVKKVSKNDEVADKLNCKLWKYDCHKCKWITCKLSNKLCRQQKPCKSLSLCSYVSISVS